VTTLEVVLASAGVAAVISTAGNLIGQALERKSRREELALSTSVSLAVTWTETVVRIYTKPTGYIGPALGDPGVFFPTYYRWVRHVMKTGELPPDVKVPEKDWGRGGEHTTGRPPSNP
jgi:hypothetical protein